MSTLEEVIFSDVLVEVLDISSDYEKQLRTINDVLSEIKVPENKPKILVFNKIDLVSREKINSVKEKFPSAIFISAMKGEGLEELIYEMKKKGEELQKADQKAVKI
jgi:GTP-binding protein HflX